MIDENFETNENNSCDKTKNPHKTFECMTLEQYNKIVSIDDSHNPIMITPDFTVVSYDAFFNRDIALIPRYVEILNFGSNYMFPIKMLPYSLKHLTIGDKCDSRSILVLNKNIIFLKSGNSYNKPLVLTKKLLHLYLGRSFSKPIKTSKYLVTLCFGPTYNEHVELSKHVVHLKINYIVAKSIIFTLCLSNIYIILPNDDVTNEKFLFEYPHKKVCLYRMHFWDWDGCYLSNNVKDNILVCYFPLKLHAVNMPSNITIYDDDDNDDN